MKLIEKSDKLTRYFDKYGNEINEDDVDVKYYDRVQTIFELKNEAKISQSLFEDNYENGNTKLKAVVGNAETHAALSAGLYVLDSDGNKKFSPGVNAEIGASVTALESSWDQQWLGDENLGLSTNVTATAGKASAKANATAQLYGEDGKLDIQLNAGAEAEAIAGEIKGSANANILGGGVGVTGSVNFGVGAHAKVGLKDGVIKCDVGASLGLGVSGSFEIDVGGMINTVAGKAESFFGW